MSTYSIKLWSPYNVAYASATYSISMPAPEKGNTLKKARNQTIVRTRAGNVKVYDRGNNKNEIHALHFERIRQDVIDALFVFLGNVQWGATRLKYEDWEGNQYIVRVSSQEIDLNDSGKTNHQETNTKRVYSFDLELLDITNPSDILVLLGPTGIASAEAFGTPTVS